MTSGRPKATDVAREVGRHHDVVELSPTAGVPAGVVDTLTSAIDQL